MRRTMSVAAATAALLLASVSPAFAQGKSETSCGVGPLLSNSAKTAEPNLGQLAKTEETTVGEAVRIVSAVLKATCTGR